MKHVFTHKEGDIVYDSINDKSYFLTETTKVYSNSPYKLNERAEYQYVNKHQDFVITGNISQLHANSRYHINPKEVSKLYTEDVIDALNSEEYIAKFRFASLKMDIPLYSKLYNTSLCIDEEVLLNIVIDRTNNIHPSFVDNLKWHINVMRKFTIFN